MNFLRLRACLFLLIVTLLFASPTRAQDPPNWRRERAKIERAWADDIQQLGNWCRDNGLRDRIGETFAWYQVRDPQRTYIFLPGEDNLPSTGDDKTGQWHAKLNQLRTEHAGRIFELAARAADADAGTAAYRLLNEVLYYNPDHEQVREILGHRRTDEGWRVTSDRYRAKKATRTQPLMGWKRGEWTQVTTTHFNIASTADEQMTELLANRLELWHNVWRQVFFEFWSRAEGPKRWINGSGSAPSAPRRKKYDIIFFANKDEYIRQLSDQVPGIEHSTGYYNDSTKASFFYADDDPGVLDTWRHELTHQLFQESIRTQADPFGDGHLWLGEGIALYFESMLDFGSYVTIGGFDSRRMQYARIRRFREGFRVPLRELSTTGRVEFQQRTDQRLIYSQSAGFTHMLMDHESGRHQDSLARAIKLMYQGKLKSRAFEEIVGLTYDQMEEEYDGFLQVSSDQVEKYLIGDPQRTELALPRAELTAAAFERISKCTRLTWIDLTGNEITGERIRPLATLTQLRSLYLTGCLVDQGTFGALATMQNLSELDLSASSVTDAELALLVNNQGLRVLRLTRTGITDAGLDQLARLSGLQELDLDSTKTTAAGRSRLQQRIPGLIVND